MSPRIYVASLSDYNNGILHGVWIDAAQPVDCIREEIEAMLAESPSAAKYGKIAEEYAIHDYEGFAGVGIGEFESINEVAELAAAIDEYGAAYAIYMDNVGMEFASVSDFQDSYCGEFEDEEDYAHDCVDNCGFLDGCPDTVKMYFDYGKFANDLFISDVWGGYDTDGAFHVFFNH